MNIYNFQFRQVWDAKTGECLFTGTSIPSEYSFPGFKGGERGGGVDFGVSMSTDTNMIPPLTRDHKHKNVAYVIEGKKVLHIYRLLPEQ